MLFALFICNIMYYRVIVEQPDDPIKYLVNSITENPYVHTSLRETEAAPTSTEEKESVC